MITAKKYSQVDEELVLLNHFGDHKGTLLDVGASDGTSYSNTRRLMESGWSGVFVEPDYEAFSKLRELYRGNPKAKLINCAVGEAHGLAEFFKHPNAVFSTMSAEWKDRLPHLAPWNPPYLVATVPLSSLFQYGPYDYINIDVEGWDEKLVRLLTPSQVAASKVISAEYVSVEERNRMVALFSALGFTRVICDNNINLLAAKP